MMWSNWWYCSLYISLLIATSSTEAFVGVLVPSLRSRTRVTKHAYQQVSEVSSSRLSASFQPPVEEYDEDEYEDVLAVGGDPGFLLSSTHTDEIQDESIDVEALGGDPWFATEREDDEPVDVDQILEDGGDPFFLETARDSPPIKQEPWPSDTKPDHSTDRQHALHVLSSLAMPSVVNRLSATQDSDSHLPVEPSTYVDSTVEAVEEVESVGGDPWFLTREGSNGQTIEYMKHAERVAEVESMGGDPFFLEEED